MSGPRFVQAMLCCVAALAAGCNRRPPLIVGSKIGTEQVVLGEIIRQHLEHRVSERIVNRTAWGGTDLLHTALISGEVDVYPEYTGTALRDVLRETLQSYEPDVVFERVRDIYRSQYHIKWFDPLGFNSAQIAAVSARAIPGPNIATMSEAEARGSGWRMAYSSDFANRPDGMPLMSTVYRLAFSAPPLLMDPRQLYQAVTNGTADMIIIRSTDGELIKGGLRLLADDRKAFPPYEPAIIVKETTLKVHPQLAAALQELSGKITAERMQRMNAEVDIGRKPPATVAAEFLAEARLL